MADSRFKILDHPADVGITAFGRSQKEIFENAALGMFSLMADLGNVENKLNFKVELEGSDPEELLVDWLSELIYLEDSKRVILNKFDIEELTDKKLKAKVWGEKIDLNRHTLFRPIKAVTYNQILLDNKQARVIFDV